MGLKTKDRQPPTDTSKPSVTSVLKLDCMSAVLTWAFNKPAQNKKRDQSDSNCKDALTATSQLPTVGGFCVAMEPRAKLDEEVKPDGGTRLECGFG